MKRSTHFILAGAATCALVLVVVWVLASSGCSGPDVPEVTSTPNAEEDVYTQPKPPTPAKYKASCRKISFKRLDRDAGLLIGRRLKITGQVFQIQDAGSGQYWKGYPNGVQPRTSMLVAVTNDGYGYWSDNVAVAYTGRLRKVFKEDTVTVWGKCLGQYSYESVAGYNMTVPAIEAKYVSQ